MGWDYTDSATYFFFGLFVACGLGGLYYWEHFDTYALHEDPLKSFNEPEFSVSEWRVGRTARPPERRDLVLFRVPGQDARLGRVVAVAGDTVEILDPSQKGELLVNGERPDERGLRSRTSPIDVPKVLVPRGCVFILCDARTKGGSDLTDSRTHGPIELACISHVFPPKPLKDAKHP